MTDVVPEFPDLDQLRRLAPRNCFAPPGREMLPLQVSWPLSPIVSTIPVTAMRNLLIRHCHPGSFRRILQSRVILYSRLEYVKR